MTTRIDLAHLSGRDGMVAGVVAALSAAGFAYQVTLTRLFSVIFQYHYVFLIVSVAIAGLSIGAAFATWMRRRGSATVPWQVIERAIQLLAILMAIAGIIMALLPSANLIGVALVAALFPYILIGFLTALLFAHFAPLSGVLYAADLIGGALGLIVGLLLVGWVGAFDAVFLLAILCAMLAFIPGKFGAKQATWVRSTALTVVLLVGFFLHQTTGIAAFSAANVQDAPPDKTMMAVLQSDQSQVLETRWDPFARVDMVTTTDEERFRYVFTDAGAGSIMIRYDGDDSRVAWMQEEMEYLPFLLRNEQLDQVMILGAGAGRDVLMAHLAGAQQITAIEINPALVALTRDAADYNGGIFDLPGVTTVVADGRNYVERDQASYDLIYANVVYSQAASTGNMALAENYIFTREALHAYWQRLSDQGRIGFVTHHGIEGLRLVVAALDMLQQQGMTLTEALQHVSLVSLNSGNAETRTSVVLITRTPWTSEEAQSYVAEVHQRGAGALYVPYYIEVGFEQMLVGAITLEDYIRTNHDFNFVPSTDDNPFFYQFRPGLPETLNNILLISAILVFVYLSWLIFFYVRTDNQHWKRASLAPYFALLGVAFMLIETPLIQRFQLLLGQPVLSLITVVGALLVGSGLGSLYSSRFSIEQLPALVSRVALAVIACVIVSLLIYPVLIRWALPLDLVVRVGITIVAILPVGFVMGIPFPSGLRIAHAADPAGITAFWGANAVTSVLGATLAMVVAMLAGFSASMLLGAAIYGGVALLILASWRKILQA